MTEWEDAQSEWVDDIVFLSDLLKFSIHIKLFHIKRFIENFIIEKIH